MPKHENIKVEAPHQENSNYIPDEDSSSSRMKNLEHKPDQQINEGKWSEEEKFKFACFLLYYQQIITSSSFRKHHRIFKKISLFLKSRKPRQCRSHYQKLSNRFKDLKDLEKYYRQRYGANEFSNQYWKVTSEFEPLPKVSEDAPTSTYEASKHIGIQTDFEPFKYNLPPCFAQFGQCNQQGFLNPYLYMQSYPYLWRKYPQNSQINESPHS